MTEKVNKYAVPALDKGLDILEFLAYKAVPLSQTEIAHGLERKPNEIYRVLLGLENRGYLIRDELSGKYKMSLKLFSLSRVLSPIDELRRSAIPVMEDFSANYGHSCHLSMLYQSQVMVIVQARSYAPVSLSISEGTLFSSVESNSGKLLLANSTSNVKSLIYERDKAHKKMSKKSRTEFEDKLVSILEDGYLFEASAITEGVTDCIVLVGEKEGAVVAALSVSLLTSQLDSIENKEVFIQAVQNVANKISKTVGC